MNSWPALLKHVLVYGWLWPLEYLIRPFAVTQRIKFNKTAEIWAMLFGSLILGGSYAFALYQIGLLASLSNVLFVFSSVASTAAIVFDTIIVFTTNTPDTIDFTVLPIVLCVYTSGFIIAGFVIAGSYGFVINSSDVKSNFLGWFIFIVIMNFSLGAAVILEGNKAITVGLAFIASLISTWIASNGVILLLIGNLWLLTKAFKEKDGSLLLTSLLSLFVMACAFVGISYETLWFVIYAALPLILITGFVLSGLSKNRSMSMKLSIFTGIICFMLWFIFWNDTFKYNMQMISISTSITFLIISGVLFYPILVFFSLWQLKDENIKYHNANFKNITPFIWQSFFLPLPFLKKYLLKLAQKKPKESLLAMQKLQTKTFQKSVVTSSLKKILQNNNALTFYACLTQISNRQTTVNLGIESESNAAILALLPWKDDEWGEENLAAVEFPIREKPGTPSLLRPQAAKIRQELFTNLEDARRKPLPQRMDFAIKKLESSSNPISYMQLLKTLKNFTNAKDIQALTYAIPSIDIKHNNSSIDQSWLQHGWQLIQSMQDFALSLQDYHGLKATEARRAFLQQTIEQLPHMQIEELGWYWKEVHSELINIWIGILEKEIKQAREWLTLQLNSDTQQIMPGNATLNLKLKNTSNVIARKTRLQLEQAKGIHWVSDNLQLPGLFEGSSTRPIRIDLQTEIRGRIAISGMLYAEDLEAHAYSWPVNFTLDIAEKGTQYQRSQKNYYTAGPGLSSDAHFVGRSELLAQIHKIWQQPENKEALLLIGMRRIGKSSIINKLSRDGVANQQIILLKADLQGTPTTLSFLQSIVWELADHFGVEAPDLNQQEPFLSFERFLRPLSSHLNGRYILVMIDEANYLNSPGDGKNYDGLPEFLRAHMQSPTSPLLLLFCGTHELLMGGRDYDSILFNTAIPLKVSYMSEREAAEVLTKPVMEQLEYDPQALNLAFELTNGHPFLLQSLGKQLIDAFDAVVISGDERPNYVTYNDMEQAVNQLAHRENAAFGNYWEASDTQTRLVLSILASYLDETSRRQVNLQQLLAYANEQGLKLERNTTADILDSLCREEFLVRIATGYRFLIALYRRWLQWHYPLDRIRERT